MGSHGHLEVILNENNTIKLETGMDGHHYIIEVLQELAIIAGRENKSIKDLDLSKWVVNTLNIRESEIVEKYDSPYADYCKVDQREKRIEVDSSYVFNPDEVNNKGIRTNIDLENPQDPYEIGYNLGSLKASLKILGYKNSVFWKDSENTKEDYKDVIDSEVPFKVEKGELLLIDSAISRPVLFEFDGEKFKEREYNK